MNLKNYETVFILTPVLSDTQMKDTAEKFKNVLTEHGAEIINLARTQAVIRIELENEGRVCALAQGTCTIRDPR